MRLQDFDYFLPQDLIAQDPLKERTLSRLMVLNRAGRTIEHTHFYRLPDYTRLDLFVLPFRTGPVHLKLGLGLHFAEGQVDYSQQFWLTLDLGGTIPR